LFTKTIYLLCFHRNATSPGHCLAICAYLLVITLAAGCASSAETDAPPFADIHLHFSYTHEEIITPAEAVDILKKNNVVLAVVSSEPSAYALKLSRSSNGWILPFASPYYKSGNRLNWFLDAALVGEIRKLLDSGEYAGIGEVHLTAGIGPRRDNPVFTGLLQLAREYQLPFLIHTDASNYRYFLPICSNYPDIRFIWAHAGGIFGPEDLEPIMTSCANVWLDMAARDPWHYAGLADQAGVLFPGWRKFIIRYQDRIMTGTDPVWNAQQIYRWYEADEGWDHYADFIRFHRNWLGHLPPAVAEKIRLGNAQRFFGRSSRTD